jgi:hypothetical protein
MRILLLGNKKMSALNQNIISKAYLEKFLPPAFTSYVHDLLSQSNVIFNIVKPRITKLGDFRRPKNSNDTPKITINSNLNPYAFLITSLHEIAHLRVYENYRKVSKPHGVEWKFEFQKLLQPLILSNAIPENLRQSLKNTITRTKAASCSDIILSRELKKYDSPNQKVFLEEIAFGRLFTLNKKTFKKGKLRRTRYLCHEMQSRRDYLVHALAEVNPILV